MVAAAAAPDARRIQYQPGLDGLRGLAMLGMLCFHSGFSWAVGGFLPIATFFTLSGYLITSLFLAEWEATGRIQLLRFWARRFRRLMPAALLTLGLMPVFAWTVATPDQVQRLPGDVLFALLYGANWHFWWTDAAYQELFLAPSPVTHFWSLSIEEQFYFAFPFVTAGALWLGSGSRKVFGAILAGLTALAIAQSVMLMQGGASIDRIYYGSDTRAPELLLGALLALVLDGRTLSSARAKVGIQVLGGLALAGMVALWSVVDLQAGWLYRGGFAAYSLLSLAVITAAVQPRGPTRWVLEGTALGWLGRISYGAYLFHWPIYLWLSAERTGLDAAPLFVLRVGLTLGLADLCYRWLGTPIRSGVRLRGWRPYLVTPVAFAAVALGAVQMPAPSIERYAYRDFDPDTALDALLAEIASVQEQMPDPVPPTLQSEKPRIAVYGDSTAFVLGVGLLTWMWKEDAGQLRSGYADLGCSLIEVGTYRVAGREMTRANHCHGPEDWRRQIARDSPDVAVVLAAPWDVADRRLPGDEVWRAPGDPVLDAHMRERYLEIVDVLTERGTLVLWLTSPRIERRAWDGTLPDPPLPSSDPARVERLNAIVRELESLRPGKVRVVDFAGYMRGLPGGELDDRYRPDGVHLTYSSALRVANEWLGPEVLRVYREQAALQDCASAPSRCGGLREASRR